MSNKATVTINYKSIGVKKVINDVDQLTKSLDRFFSLAKKYNMPKNQLKKMLDFQIERMGKGTIDIGL